jgi:membrane protein required for colicin V production
MEPLSNLDIVILIGFAISMLVAFIRGFVTEVLSILGLALFVILVVYFSPMVLPLISKYIASKILAQIVAFLLIMAVFYTIWIIGTDRLVMKIRKSTLSFMDRLFGLIFGLIRALLILGFCFLIIKVILPEELKDDMIKKSKFFVVAQTSSDMIEKLLPEKFVEETVASVKDSVADKNKVEKKTEEKEKKEDKDNADNKEKTEDKGLPSKIDQEQMNKMFEQLIKPEVKSDKKTENKSDTKKTESKGYDSKEINNLDRLIDITTKN